MRFPGIRLIEQKFRRFEKKRKQRVTNSRALLLIKAPTKKRME